MNSNRNSFQKSNWLQAVFFLGVAFFQSAEAQVKFSQEVRVIDPSRLYLHALSRHPEIIIDHVNSLGYEVYGPSGLQAWLKKYRIPFVNGNKVSASFAEEYPSPEAIVEQMVQIQRKFPQLVQLIEIGRSVQGRPLMVARMTAPDAIKTQRRKKPEFKYIANMHGDEIAGRELMIRFMRDLAQGYGSDPRITKLLEQTDIYIMPSMNPDGAAARSRFNANGADLNRSFPDFTTPDNRNDWGNREPEVQAVMKFQAQHQFLLSANFHGGAEVVNYPWDTKAEPFPLDQFIVKLSLDYSRKVPYMWNSREFKNGIVNGHAWYEVNGGMQDWSYYWHKDIQVTVELTNSKWPRYDQIDSYYQENRSAILSYAESVHVVAGMRR